MIIYHQINPIALQLGPVAVHWYGIMYLVGFAAVWLLATYRMRKPYWSHWTKAQISDVVFYGALGAILGGRIGYTFVYNLPAFLADPLILFKIWQGGMSFHGGLFGVAVAWYFYSIYSKKPYFTITDFIAPFIPIGLAAGRLGNFINGELWGRLTTLPWGVVYPDGGPLPRHPSEIYEFLLEGVLLFIILWIYSRKPKPYRAVTGMFMVCYGVFRSFGELFREPDSQLGFIIGHWLTMGQILSFIMIILGIILLVWSYLFQRCHPEHVDKSIDVNGIDNTR